MVFDEAILLADVTETARREGIGLHQALRRLQEDALLIHAAKSLKLEQAPSVRRASRRLEVQELLVRSIERPALGAGMIMGSADWVEACWRRLGALLRQLRHDTTVFYQPKSIDKAFRQVAP